MKKIISMILIFLVLLNTSCFTTYQIKREEINSLKSGYETTVITNDDELYYVFVRIVKDDSLYCRFVDDTDSLITIPFDNIKMAEVEDINMAATTILLLPFFLYIAAFGGFRF